MNRRFGQGLQTALQDVRFACRSLRRSPGFTAVVAATLALGIGANLTMFGLMRAVLWRPLPYPDPGRIVTIRVDARNTPNTGATMGEVRDLRERSRTLERVSMINGVDANLEYAGESEHVSAVSVSDDFLPLLGVRPALGRELDTRIDEGKQQVLSILVSDELWRRRFSADPHVIGRSVRVNNLDVQVVGVLPHGFRLYLPPSIYAAEQVDVWFPAGIDPTQPFRGIPVVARLRPGVTLDQANAELRTLVAQFEKEYPAAYAGTHGRFTAAPLHEEMTRDAQPSLFLLAGAVGFVLLIACVNVANLLFARGAARRRELEIRRALGAGRIRIVRQLLTESLILAATSAALGLLFARGGLKIVGRLSASHIPLQSRVGMDATIATAAVALAVVTSMLFGLLPAWRLASGGVGLALRAGRAETAGAGARRLQRTLVVAEVALSIVPLACGGLMLRTFVNLRNAPLGFDPANVITAKVPFSMRQYPHLAERWAFLRDVMQRVRMVPGVRAVSAASPLPLAGQETRRVGRVDRPGALPILATQQIAAPGYLAVIGTRLLAGRDFTDDEVTSERNVTIIDESLASRLWPEGAIGKVLSVYRTGWRNDLEVIGVTAPVRSTAVRDEGIPHYVMPYGLYPSEMTLVVKTHQTANQMAPWIQAAVHAAHGFRAPFDIRPMSDYVSDSIGDTRFLLLVLATFAGAAILLAGVGLYGTLAYLTAQRTREFGIRLALGSTAGGIVKIVIREGAMLGAAGAALGLAGAAVATGAIQGLLYGVRPLDGMTLAGVAVLVGTITLAAAGVPAWRASRIDPQASLRSE